MDENNLLQIFSEFGSILDLTVIRDRATNIHKGCAFVVYANRNAALTAVERLHEQVKLPNVRPLIFHPHVCLNYPPIGDECAAGAYSREQLRQGAQGVCGDAA